MSNELDQQRVNLLDRAGRAGKPGSILDAAVSEALRLVAGGHAPVTVDKYQLANLLRQRIKELRAIQQGAPELAFPRGIPDRNLLARGAGSPGFLDRTVIKDRYFCHVIFLEQWNVRPGGDTVEALTVKG